MNKKLPLVSVIIPAFRSEFFIEGIIESLKKMRYPNYEIIIVFDPSEDRGPEIARRLVGRNKHWHIIENKIRLGSTKSLNLGIKKSKGEFIGFVACDMTLDPDWMRELTDYLLHSDSSVGAAIAKFYDFHRHDYLQVYRLYLMRQTGWVASLDFGRKDGLEYQKLIETFNGFEGLIVRREVFSKIGMFDEDVDALIYDLDMSWRLWLAGYKMIEVPKAKVYHWSLKEGRQNAKWEFFYARMINLFIKNYSLKSLIVYLPQFVIIYTARAFWLLLRGNTDPVRGWIEAIIWTIGNLPKTIKKRHRIQTEVRKVSDEYLFDKIFYQGSLLSFYRYWKQNRERFAPILMNEESSNRKAMSYSA